MKAHTLWTLLATFTASLALEAAPALALDVPDVPAISSASRLGAPFAKKKKRKRGPKRGGRVQPLGGVCAGTSVITETDELGGQIFPRSITPVTTDSFIFSHVKRPLFSPVEAALRAIVLGEDPPMVTLASIELGALALEPDSLTVVGIGSVDDERGIVRCNGFTPAACQVAIPVDGLMSMERVNNDLFAVIMLDGQGNDVTRFITAEGEQISILEPADKPMFFERTLAVRGDTVFVAGYLGLESRSVVLAVPLDGGPIREEVTFDPGLHPGRMVFLGSDLVIEIDAQVSDLNPEDSQPSRLIRVQFDQNGEATSFTDIPISAPGFVNVTDLEALDGQLFVVDSRLTRRSEGTSVTTGQMVSGRILRICPQ